MLKRSINKCRILIVEDEYLLADELRIELEEAGAFVLGPISSVKEAITMVVSGVTIDSGILDVHLGGEMVFAAADLLVERNIPFVFATGYDAAIIPGRFAGVVLCEKPLQINYVIQAIGR